MSDNPFSEPGDDDRTVIRPIPGGRRTAAAPSRPAPGPGMVAASSRDTGVEPVGGTATADFSELGDTGLSPIVASAAPLLSLLGRLRQVASVPDPGALREHAIGALKRFEREVRARNTPIDQLRFAHYALCASLDDVVLSSPWGQSGPWTDASLVSTFHHEVQSGERFFDVLAQMRQHPSRFLGPLEIAYLCMSLGMQGRYRISARGPAELERIREEIYVLVMRQKGAAERTLSPHWLGISAPYRPVRARLPVWVALLFGIGLVCLVWCFATLALNNDSDRLFSASRLLKPTHMPNIARAPSPIPTAPPPPPRELRHLAQALAPEIAGGTVSVAGTDADPILRLGSRAMFASGSADVDPRALPLLRRIAAVLQDEPGRIEVAGYTDNQPIHTVRFPSNYQLSLARARASARVIAAALSDPNRIAAEGRADADPIADNATASGRDQNRRIEVVLHRAADPGSPAGRPAAAAGSAAP
ncbi:MAG: type VI secretion system protein TssL [Gluconacetobacter diazotrophicus]|nr:type VI secretion system protein TssL [Gluconacetobacter diazotrophicus]